MQDENFGTAALYWVAAGWTVTFWQASVKMAGVSGFALQQQFLLRFVGAGLFTLLAGWLHTGSLGFVATRTPRVQLARSACLAVMTWGVFIGTRYLALAHITALLFSWPALGQVIGAVSFQEKLTLRSVLSVVVCLLGVLLLVLGRHSGGTQLPIPGVLAVLAAAAASGYLAHFNRLAKKAGDGELTSLLYMCCVGAAIVLGWLAVVAAGRPAVRAPLPSSVLVLVWSWVAASGPWPSPTPLHIALAAAVVVLGVALQWLYIQAAQRAPVSRLMPLTYLFQLPFSVVLGRYYLGDAWPGGNELAAYAVIIGGALLKYLFPSLGA